jgi:hypothetical protein
MAAEICSARADFITNILAESLRGESGIGRTEPASMFGFITCHFGKILKSTEEFYTHFTF